MKEGRGADGMKEGRGADGMKRGRTRRPRESGFALLLVFVMAAAISITLFIEVPRIAFESQRTREQMAIDRGLQYQRAIQLFYRKYRLYPQTLDDLETTRNIRFLRFRYLDPLTGKPYRLLHVGPAGQLTDSLVQPPAPLPGSSTGSSANTPFGASQNSQTSQTSASTNSSPPADPNNPNGNPNDPNAPQAPDPLNMAARRPSDRIIGGPGGAPGTPNGDQPPVPEPDPNQPQPPGQPVSGVPGVPVQQPTDPNQPVNPANPAAPIQPGIPGVPGQPGQPGFPGQTTGGQPTGQPTDPSQPAPSPTSFPPGLNLPGTNPGQTPIGQTPTGQTPYPQNPAFPQMPGQQGGQLPGQLQGQLSGQAGQVPPGTNQSASNLIQQILTTPRQPPSSVTGFTTGNTGGIAGVASTAEGKGIHKVNDRTKYKEWEFVYDLKKDKTVVGAAAVNAQQNVQTQMQQNQTSSPFGNSSSPFNSSPTSSQTPTAPANSAAPTTPPPSQ
jgi:hypothetical protein